MANSDFILPFLHKEFSATTRDWTDAEVGAYLRLLVVQWDQGSIPESIDRLRKIADSIDQTKDLVLQKFKPCGEPGRLKNLKMELIREERKNFRAVKSKAGKAGMKSRYQKTNRRSNKHGNKTLTFNQDEVEVKVDIDSEIKNEVITDADIKKIPPSRFYAQQQFSINKPDHWSTEYMEREVDAWFDHYNANGWMVSKNKMKDWKAAIRTWIRNDYNFKKETNGATNTATKKQWWVNAEEQLRREAEQRTEHTS